MKKFKKIVLAYSGGLDTSVMITWLKENYDNCEVIAVVGNVGQGDSELEGIEEKALKTGASKIYVEDLKEELVNDYIVPTIKAGAKYEGEYLTWSKDGLAGYLMYHNEKFSITNHRGILIPIKECIDIDLKYIIVH